MSSTETTLPSTTFSGFLIETRVNLHLRLDECPRVPPPTEPTVDDGETSLIARYPNIGTHILVRLNFYLIHTQNLVKENYNFQVTEDSPIHPGFKHTPSFTHVKVS